MEYWWQNPELDGLDWSAQCAVNEHGFKTKAEVRAALEINPLLFEKGAYGKRKVNPWQCVQIFRWVGLVPRDEPQCDWMGAPDLKGAPGWMQQAVDHLIRPDVETVARGIADGSLRMSELQNCGLKREPLIREWARQFVERADREAAAKAPPPVPADQLPDEDLVMCTEFSVRAHGILDKAGLTTRQQIRDRLTESHHAIRQLRNCGRITELEILRWAWPDHPRTLQLLEGRG